MIICTILFNQPEFLKYQYRLLKKYILVPFKFYVFDNSYDNTPEITKKFNNLCNELNIEYIRVPQNIFNHRNDPSYRAGKSLDYGLRFLYQNFPEEIIMVNDSDLFLFDYFNPIERLKDNDIVGRSNKNIYLFKDPNSDIVKNQIFYITNQFFIVNFKKFNPSLITFEPYTYNNIGLDCGGFLYKYFNDNLSIKYEFIHDHCSGLINKNNLKDIEMNLAIKKFIENDLEIMEPCFSEIFDYKFLHFRAGSNWINFSSVIYENRLLKLI